VLACESLDILCLNWGGNRTEERNGEEVSDALRGYKCEGKDFFQEVKIVEGGTGLQSPESSIKDNRGEKGGEKQGLKNRVRAKGGGGTCT